MALPTSGALSLENIQTEFGGSNPIGLSEYYAGGGLVPAGASGTYGAVPSSGALSVQNFYGTQAYTPVYVEEVFSTYTYDGSGLSVNRTITNGINLSANGGLVWTKARSTYYSHMLCDSARGFSNYLRSNGYETPTWAGALVTMTPTTSGYTVNDVNGSWNESGQKFVSHTFRKKAKFFDIVTYTGTGVARTIAHNLGSTPGCIMIKALHWGLNWHVYHRGLTSASYVTYLNTPTAETSDSVAFNGTAPTSSVFSVGAGNYTNEPGGTYVAYIFAHDAGGFGPTGTDNVISCGSYTGNGSSTGPIVNVGFEPQWLLVKCSSTSGNWVLVDTFRGMPVRGNGYSGTALLYPNVENGESNDSYTGVAALATGFQPNTTSANLNTSGQKYLYVAIRRTGEKVPTDATKVFNAVAYSNSSFPDGNTRSTGNQPDLVVSKGRVTSYGNYPMWYDRIRGGDSALSSNSASGESNGYTRYKSFNNDSVTYGYDGSAPYVNGPGTFIAWVFTRAKGFFDEVYYTGNGTNGTAYSHQLAVVPELVIVKGISSNSNWKVLYQPAMRVLTLNTTAAYESAANTQYYFGNDTIGISPTSTQFTVSNGGSLNNSGVTYVAYLFASCSGVSKVGSYTGTGAAQTINCGFAAGARFVMIKRADASGYWYVFDSVRGIVSGNDPFSTINDSSGESYGDYLSPQSSGFGLTAGAPADLNASGGTFIYLAIA